MEHGIKELKEMLDGLELIAVSATKIAANGKLGVEDLGVVMSLLRDVDKIKEAFQGLGDIPAEIKDLSKEELTEIATKVFDIVAKVRLELAVKP